MALIKVGLRDHSIKKGAINVANRRKSLLHKRFSPAILEFRLVILALIG